MPAFLSLRKELGQLGLIGECVNRLDMIEFPWSPTIEGDTWSGRGIGDNEAGSGTEAGR
jgi:hypothetical protein